MKNRKARDALVENHDVLCFEVEVAYAKELFEIMSGKDTNSCKQQMKRASINSEDYRPRERDL